MKKSATTVALNGKAYLITGVSGVGKSSLALTLIHQGATLISDDLTDIKDNMAYAPQNRKGFLEVRGIGPVGGFPVCEKAPIVAEIQITAAKPERFPEPSKASPPVFHIWEQDPHAADKVWVIEKMISNTLTVR